VGLVAATVVATWAGDPDRWLRRTAPLVQRLPMLRGDADAVAPFVRIAAPMLGERAGFVRKAIGQCGRVVIAQGRTR
jgi:hypothetical protein